MNTESDRIKMIKGMLINTERFRADLMEELNRLDGNKEAFGPVNVYPMANIEQFEFNQSPVYQFSYHGALPPYEGMSREYIKLIKDYYYSSTIKSLDFMKVHEFQNTSVPVFNEKVSVFFAHFFSDLNIRDLDNRNKKFVLDPIRFTKIIKDDNWQELSLFDSGFLDQGHNHLQVFVLLEKNLFPFVQEFQKNKEKYIENKRFEKQFEQFKEAYNNDHQ